MDNEHNNNTEQPKAYIYVEAANGMTVRIPADKYDDWKAAQERIKRGEKVADTEMVKKLTALMKGEETAEFEKKASIPAEKETTCTHQIPLEKKIMKILTSKRIAAIVAILICITLYFALLSNVFTTKQDTYTCYIVNGQIHDINCYELDKNNPVETTVYEAIKHNKIHGCNFTNQTTLTQKNYVAPILISAPISALVYFILTSKKFE